MNDRFDPDIARAELDKCMILLSHYLRHIRLHKDYETANEYHHKIFKLEADARRVYKETKNNADD